MKMISKDNASQLRIGEKVAVIGTVYLGSGTASQLPIDIATVCKVTKAQVVVALSTGRVAFSGSETFRLTEDGSNRHVKSSGYSDRLHNTCLKAFESAEEVEAEDAILKERKAAKAEADRLERERRDAERAEADAKHKAEVDSFWVYRGEEMWQQGVNVETACGTARAINYPSRDAQGAMASAMVFIHVVPSDRISRDEEERVEAQVEMTTIRPNKDWQGRFAGVLSGSRSFKVRGKKVEERELRELARREAVWQLVERC